MPIHFPTSSFFESAGSEAESFLTGMRDQTADFACQIWSAYPRFFTQNKSLGSSFARGYMNSMCQNRVMLPAYPTPPFQGGQCPGVQYEILLEATTTFNGSPRPNATARLVVYGEIVEISVKRPTPTNDPRIIAFFAEGKTVNGDLFYTSSPIGGVGWDAELIDTVVSRLDGQPDDCGEPDVVYPSPDPTSSDLTTIINIDIPDGQPFIGNLTYNQLSPTFNFPMGFRINGVNITLDVSGITIYGGDTYLTPDGNNDVDPPGGSGGGDGVGGGDTEVRPTQDYPTLPTMEEPKPEEVDIESIVCTEGVTEIISSTLKVASGMSGWVGFVSAALNILLTDLCESEDECVVGFPEYYEVKPGADRASLVYLYKTLSGGKWGSSTYSSTLTHPSPAAVAEVDSLLPPPRTLGKHVATLRLTDGAVLKASGIDQGSALVSLGWLTSRVLPTLIPADATERIVVSYYPLLQEPEVRLRAIEYYPNGAGSNKTPEIRRYIDADEYS